MYQEIDNIYAAERQTPDNQRNDHSAEVETRDLSRSWLRRRACSTHISASLKFRLQKAAG